MKLLDAVRRLFQSFLVEPLRRIDREQREYMAGERSRRPDGKVVVVLITAAVVLTLQNYFGGAGTLDLVADLLDGGMGTGAYGMDAAASSWNDRLANRIRLWLNSPRTGQLASLLYWAGFSFATYFFIPWFVIAVFFRQRLSDYGCKLRGAFADWWIYVVFFLVMGPLLLWVSTHRHFQLTFPFYRLRPGEPLWPNFWTWELAYFVQFIGLEFFFRGFMVHGTKHRFGFYSVFVMMVPYCMIHYGKPMPETFGAIGAGIVLGFMSLKTRSIWLGAAIHMSVALSMDFLSMWRKGLFP